MHKLVTKGHFWRGPPNLKRIKYFNLNFCHNHLLTKPNICAKFEQNRWFELHHLLPGFLMDTLLNSFFPVTGLECSYEKIFFPVTKISVAKTELSVTGPARPLIWTHQYFLQRKERRGEISGTEPARLTGLIWRGLEGNQSALWAKLVRWTNELNFSLLCLIFSGIWNIVVDFHV